MSEQTKPTKHEAKSPARRTLAPAVDIYENRDGFVLLADLPGVSQEALTVRLDQGELSFEGLRKPQAHGSLLGGDDAEVLFKRSFTLPGGIDADKIEARLTAGVLELKLPKAASLKPRQISVRVG